MIDRKNSQHPSFHSRGANRFLVVIEYSKQFF